MNGARQLFVSHAHSLLLLFLFAIPCVSVPFVARAQENQAGVTIAPALIEENINAGESRQYSVTITNQNESEQTFYLSTRNISDVVDGGTPVFSEQTEKTGMELADWITLPVTEVTLPARGSQRVEFAIAVPENAACSYFGSIFVSVDPPEIENSGAAVGYKVANIISLRVAGDCNETANIRQFSTDRYFHGSKNVDFTTRIENNGNVLVRPVGPVVVTNMLGQSVDTFTFNENNSAVFPGTVREYNFNWTGEGTGFGRYEAVLSAVYGDSGARKTISSTVSFWILPMNIIGPALGVLALLLLITFISVKLYIRRTLAYLSEGQGRIVRKRKTRGVSTTLLLVVVMLTVTALFLIALLVLFA